MPCIGQQNKCCSMFGVPLTCIYMPPTWVQLFTCFFYYRTISCPRLHVKKKLHNLEASHYYYLEESKERWRFGTTLILFLILPVYNASNLPTWQVIVGAGRHLWHRNPQMQIHAKMNIFDFHHLVKKTNIT